MFMWTVSKQKFIGVLCIIFAIAVILGLFFNTNISVATTTRKLPVYSVDTSEKKVAITFDAAWTNQDTDQIIEILKKHNLKHIRFHDLRHTYASLLLANGAPMKYVQHQLGHSSITMTMDLYTHLLPEVNDKCVNLLNSKFKEPDFLLHQFIRIDIKYIKE